MMFSRNSSSIVDLRFAFVFQYGVRCAQVLVTPGDFDNEKTKANLKSTMEELLRLNIIPLVNENDVMSDPATSDADIAGTISLKDNDSLAAMLAIQFNAKAMCCLSDVDGVYTAPPGSEGARLLNSYNPIHQGRDVKICEYSAVGRGALA